MKLRTRPHPQAGERSLALAAFELASVNLELLPADERHAVVQSLADWYDSIPRAFQLLSVPIERDPSEHLGQVAEHTPPQARRLLSAYGGLYRELAASLRRPPRRAFVVLQAASETELERTTGLVTRSAEEHGVRLRAVESAELDDLRLQLRRDDASYRLTPTGADGTQRLAFVSLGRRWPAQIAPGWIAGLLALPGLDAVSLRVRPLTRSEAMSFMTVRLRQVRAADRLAAERGELDDVERERIVSTASSARRIVHAGAARVYLVDPVLLLAADDPAQLTERLEALRLEARTLGFEPEVATFRVADAWRSIVPGETPAPLAERNLDSSSLAASLLHVAGDLYEPAGHLYGRVRSTGAPIVLDRFARPSHSAIVLGQTGTGKTMATGAEMARCVLQGVRVLAVDPLGDYRRLTTELGGLYLEPGVGGKGINPFALTGTRAPGALSAKLQVLVPLVGAMANGLSRDERASLDTALQRVYERAGIGADPATHDRTPPQLGDLVTILRELPRIGNLPDRLERWASGSLASVFRGAPPALDRPLVVVGLDGLADPEVRAVAELAALALLWDAVRADLNPKLVVVDEAWKLMQQPAGAAFVEELARSARHYHAGLQLATQDIVEFLRSGFGEPIVKQCDIRVLLGQTPEGADALARYFDLTPTERRSLIHARPGEGLLFIGRSHVAFEAVVSRREYDVLTSRPSDLLERMYRA